jgi:hypothetical protein
MSDPEEFTPKELYQISLFKQPGALARQNLLRAVSTLAISVAITAYGVLCDEVLYMLVGFAVLFFHTLYRLLVTLPKGVHAFASIIAKYENKIQKLQSSR